MPVRGEGRGRRSLEHATGIRAVLLREHVGRVRGGLVWANRIV